jgi:outer membrane protein OmpA-like peptidoglycan-associated protein
VVSNPNNPANPNNPNSPANPNSSVNPNDPKGQNNPSTSPTPINPKAVYFDAEKGLYVKNNKPFTGKDNGTTYKNGKVVGGKTPTDVATTGTKKDKPVDPNTVHFDNATGLYVKGDKPYTGKFHGKNYKDGKDLDGLQPSSTVYTSDPETKAYLLHIYYDFDQANLRDESMPELQKLLKLMKDNPSQIVEISSHTDARGSNTYNNRLSQRRAESVVRWLIDKGVERDRLVPRGYGETMTSNKCVNQIKCTEEEHQLNRRTEFRVLGCKDCVDKDKVKLSQPKEHPKVDKCHGCPF